MALWLCLLAATATDLIWGKIFNWLTVGFLLLGAGSRLYAGGSTELTQAFLSILIALVIFFPLYRLQVFQAGDVKLFMAVGAWVSPTVLIELAGTSFLVGAMVGGLGLVESRLHGVLLAGQSGQTTPTPKNKRHHMPFAPAVLSAYMLMKIASHYHWGWL